MSPVSIHNGGSEADEIVVGNNSNGDKSSPLRVTSDHEDEDMGGLDDDEPVVSHYPKRKRASVYNDLSEEKIETSLIEEEPEPPPRFVKPIKRPLGSVKGVILGYWRDSPVPDDQNRHSVIGFIDIRDRLRTRIQPTTRSGAPVDPRYPLPPGPGGSWVTFERVVFDDHLVGLDHYQVKEYVKLRSDRHEPDEESRKAAITAAIEEAIRRCKANPPPEHLPAPAIAYGAEMPERANSGRPEAKRRRTGSGIGTINSGGPIAPALAQAVNQDFGPRADPIPGTRPTRILLGYWRGSSEPDAADRHAVYGILGQNDMFRVKVVRETRDGRFVDGNFPSGAGALWIHYEEVEFETHLKHLTRNEIKEYCRIRQRQLDDGETAEDRVANETQAVYEAQTRVQSGYRSSNYHSQALQQSLGMDDTGTPERRMQHIEPKTAENTPELRQSRRATSQAETRQPARHSLPDVSARLPGPDALERTNSIARREIARAEAAQQRIDRHAANREAAMYSMTNAIAQQQQQQPLPVHQPQPQQLPPPPPQIQQMPLGQPPNGLNGSAANRQRFGDRDEMQRLNTVWAKQEAHRIKSGAEDAKMYLGIKYERKAGGPFAGKLVSQGTIISIDGEDYVEYRVLTKPSFF